MYLLIEYILYIHCCIVVDVIKYKPSINKQKGLPFFGGGGVSLRNWTFKKKIHNLLTYIKGVTMDHFFL